MSLVQRFPLNETGKDYLVTDIHGCFDQVLIAMRAVNFDPASDRLFCCGDTVDRGPGSPRARRFIEQPWVHCTRGNHEDMFLELYENGEPHPVAIEFVTSRNGMNWWQDFPQADRLAMIESFRKLPVAIEIETRRGTVGLVHAEVPAYLDWPSFIARVEANDRELIKNTLWGRGRIYHDDDTGVPGIGRVFVGHTPQQHPRRMGNVYYLDTGAVFGILDDNHEKGRLTFAELAARTGVFNRRDIAKALIDLRVDQEPTLEPFGSYAQAL